MNDKPFLEFKPKSEEITMFFDWWSKLKDNKGLRAELRRCATIAEVNFVHGFHVVLHELQAIGKVNREKSACVLGLLSHVKNNNDTGKFAEQMSATKDGGKNSKVSGLRFRRLLKCKTHEELFTDMRRIIKLLDSTVNIEGIAADVYNWGDFTKKQWAYDYYSNAPADEK
jgi:CRISPR system Cascade subunit CasB